MILISQKKAHQYQRVNIAPTKKRRFGYFHGAPQINFIFRLKIRTFFAGQASPLYIQNDPHILPAETPACSPDLPPNSIKTNAARASHPSRIVVADASDCRLPPGTEDHRGSAAPKSPAPQCQLRLSPQASKFSASILPWRRISKEAAMPRLRLTGDEPNPPTIHPRENRRQH
jgi:hypothetical protein